MGYFKRLINVCVFILIWLGVPYLADAVWVGLLSWIPALIITLYLEDE